MKSSINVSFCIHWDTQKHISSHFLIMTIKNFLENVQNKHFDLRGGGHQGYYGGGHMGYNYQPQPNYHQPHSGPVFKHYSFSKSTNIKSSGAAMSALTLLSFLFFLNILQQCLKDQMASMNPTVAVMQAGKQEVEVDRSSILNEQSETTMLRLKPIQSNLGNGMGKTYATELEDQVTEDKIDKQRSLIKLKNGNK